MIFYLLEFYWGICLNEEELSKGKHRKLYFVSRKSVAASEHQWKLHIA